MAAVFSDHRGKGPALGMRTKGRVEGNYITAIILPHYTHCNYIVTLQRRRSFKAVTPGMGGAA